MGARAVLLGEKADGISSGELIYTAGRNTSRPKCADSGETECVRARIYTIVVEVEDEHELPGMLENNHGGGEDHERKKPSR